MEGIAVPLDIQVVAMTDPSDASGIVAGLLYETAPDMFDALWGKAAKGILGALVPRSQNRYRYRYAYLAKVNQQIVGVATMLPAENIQEHADYTTVLRGWTQFRFHVVQHMVMRHLVRLDYPAGTAYLESLAVHSNFRNQGIGTQLLEHCITLAKATHKKQLYISVDIHNGRAQKLYESLGFKPYTQKTLQLLRWQLGSRVLALELEPNG